LLEVDGLEAAYGPIVALSGVHLAVPAGALVALVGPNGAGKSTLLRAISGLVPARRGVVRLDGVDLARRPPDQRVELGIAQVPEGREILRRMSVEENLLLGAYRRQGGAAVRQDLDGMYRRFRVLAERRRQPAGVLSGGEQQQLAIARALMARPRLLLLDEPSLGLAPLLVAQVFELIQALRAEGLTILLVEQNARQALRVADLAYVLALGRVALAGSASDVLASPQLGRAYLGGSRESGVVSRES
jgi:branched-chain amino acid transport system ATP-binding protein